MGSESGTRRRVRVERGIYRQANGKYAVCCRHAGRLRFRTVGFDLDLARRERVALIAAAQRGLEPVSPRLRFDTVAACWLERFEAKVAAAERHPRTLEATATSSTVTCCRRSPPVASRRSPSIRSPSCCSSFAARVARPRPQPAPGNPAQHHPLRPAPRLDHPRPDRSARARGAPAGCASPPTRPGPRRDRTAPGGLPATRAPDGRHGSLQRPADLRDARPHLE